ncbi:SHRM4 protein, partial [Polyodon spathula]|nr:SHRM4 protein [Polyodon spathula]
MDQRVETIDQLVSFQHIQVHLQGGAPWGFTLKGGLEHGEPLIVSKIEEGGKAALSKKLGIGDELVSINGSALYGSRQEALVLIKGSYRILKMVVRRRNVPVIRPHSWHLAKLSEQQPDSPAMQFHPGSFSLSWHSGCESSDLSMQWNQLSRHCSTDRSSSIGSMESLDPPSQGYYEGQLSPVDQSIFHDKRDSAYSSFSASSNTSDYAVSLKPDEAGSLDNLHGLGPCRYAEGRCVHGVIESGGLSEDGKPCCLSQHSEVKGHQSSYSEDRNRSASKGPPQPPIRRESFKATRTGPGFADKRTASDPVHMLNQSSNCTSDTLLSNSKDLPNCNSGCSPDARNLQQNDAVDQYYMLSSQLEQCKSCSPETVPNDGYLNQHSTDASRQKNYSPCVPEEFGCLGGKREALMGHHEHTHSAPEKFFSSQLPSLDLSSRRDSDLDKPAPHDPYVWKGSPLHPQEEENLTSKEIPHSATKGYNAEWGESGCSTPGSVTASEIVEPKAETDTIDGHLDVGSCNNRTWGRCFSVSGEMPKPVPETLDLKNTGLTSASSVDTLLGETRIYDESKPEVAAKPAASRQHRSSKARRRSERFATNLRNEIQRKKAQLQKSRGSSTLLYGEETVEEVSEQPEYDSPCSDSSPSSQGSESKLNKTTNPTEVHISQPDARSQEAVFRETRSSSWHQNTSCRSPNPQQKGPQNTSCREISEKKEDQTHGRGGRWKWTPEHKLQPQVKPEKENHSRMTSDVVRPSKPAPTLASKESDILPFADRRKFFEETSKSLASSHLPNLPLKHNKSDLSGKYLEKPNCNPNNLYCPGERRYSTGQTCHSPEVLSACHPTELRPVEQQTCCNQDKDEADLDHSCCYRIRASETVAHKLKAYFVSEDCRVLPHRHRQPCDQYLDTRNSDFYPTPVALYEECASHHVCNPARKPLFEAQLRPCEMLTIGPGRSPLAVKTIGCCRIKQFTAFPLELPLDPKHYIVIQTFPVEEQEQRKINRKASLTERWIPHRAASSYDLSQDQDSTSWTTTPLEGHSEGAVNYPQRGRALSESNVQVDLQRLQRLHRREFGGPPALCELEEPRSREEEAGKKKGPPPPRPPPPNWERYKHRRASHSALCSLPTSQRAPPLGYNSSPSDSSPPPCSLETSRQRSRSLPLREPLENYLKCFHEPHELLLANHRSALVPKTCNPVCCAGRQDSSCELHGDPVPPKIPDALAVPVAAGLRSSIKPEKGSEGLAESYFAMNYEQNGDVYKRPEEFKKAAPTTTKSILIQPEENILETNIDEYRHEGAICEGLPACYQSTQDTPTYLGVSVLETDIDTVSEEGEEPPQLEVVKAALVNLTPEELLRDIVSTDSSLASILDPCSRLTAADLMEEIFPRSEENRPAEKRRNNRNVLQLKVDIQPERLGPSASPTSSSSYYSTSAGKAELLNRMKELPGMEEEEEDDELTFKKQQLIDSLSRKLSVLREAQQSLLEDIGANCTLGEEVESLVQTVCKPNELDKFRMFIGDLEKVVSLLLSLSGRLARVENALSGLSLEASHDERLALTEKKKQLSGQLGEARELKEHVDRRERVVLEVLSRYLTEVQLQDYRHFVKMKSALIIEQRQLEEKIRLGEEQLRCLRESLGTGLAHC